MTFYQRSIQGWRSRTNGGLAASLWQAANFSHSHGLSKLRQTEPGALWVYFQARIESVAASTNKAVP
jgi:hypothetical protein